MSTDIASLNISIDSSDTRNATQSLGRLEGQSKKTETATERMRREFDHFQGTMNRAGGQIDGFRAKIGRMAGAFTSLQGVIAAAGIGYLATDIAKAGMEVQSLERAFKTITGSTQAAQRELAFVSRTAEELGLSLTALEQSYKGISAAAQGTVLAGQETRDIFKSVAEASAVLGLSADETKGALNALSQMISKGNVQAEELRGQLGERLPGAFQMAASAMGVTTSELSKMLEQGEVMAEDLLPKLAEELTERFGKGAKEAADDARGAFARLGNQMTVLKREFAESGFLDALADSAADLAETMKDPEFRQGVQEVGRGIGQMITAIAEGIGAVGQFIGYMKELNEQVREYYAADRDQIFLGRGQGYGQGGGGASNVKQFTDEMIMNSERARREVLGNVHQMEEVVVTANRTMAESTKKHKEEVEDLSGTYDEMYNLGAFISEQREKELHAASARHSVEEWKGANDEVERDTKDTHDHTMSWLEREYERFSDNLSRTLVDEMIDGTGDIEDVFKTTLKNIIAYYANNAIIVPVIAQLGLPGLSGPAAQQMQSGGFGGFDLSGAGGIMKSLGLQSGGSSFMSQGIPGTSGAPSWMTSNANYQAQGLTPQAAGSPGITIGQGLTAAGGLYQMGTNIGGFGETGSGTASTVSGGLKVASAVPGPHSPFTAAAAAVIDIANSLGAFDFSSPDDTDFEAKFGRGRDSILRGQRRPGTTAWSSGTDVVNFAKWEGSYGTRTYDFGRDMGSANTGEKFGQAVHSYVRGMITSLEESFDVAMDEVLRQESLLVKIGEPKSAAQIIDKINKEFINTYTDNIANAVLGGGAGNIVDADFLNAVKKEGEGLTATFDRTFSVLKFIPDSIERLRTYIEDGYSEAEAFGKLQSKYEYVSGTLAPAIQQGLNESIQSLSFEDFKSGLRSNIENQMKQAVLTAAQQDFTKNIIQGAFDEVGGLEGLMQDYFAGDIGLDELTTQFDTAMDKIENAMDEEAFDRFTDALRELGVTAEQSAEKLESNVTDARQDYISALEREYNSLQDEQAKLEQNLSDAKSTYVSMLQDEQSELQSTADAMEQLTKSLSDYHSEILLGSESILGIGQQARFARSEFMDTAELARMGDRDAMQALQDVSSDYISAARAAGTGGDAFREVQKALNATEAAAAEEMTVAEMQLDSIKKQLKAVQDTENSVSSIERAQQQYQGAKLELDRWNKSHDLVWYEQEINRLDNIANATIGVQTALKEYQNALTNAIYSGYEGLYSKFKGELDATKESGTFGGGVSGGGRSSLSTDQYVESQYQKLFGRTSNASGKDFWSDAIDEGVISRNELKDEMLSAASDRDRRAAKELGYEFASGGTISGPESGYSLPGVEFHGVEHITPDSQMTEVKEQLASIKEILGMMLNTNGDQSKYAKKMWQILDGSARGNQPLQTESA